MSTAMTEPTITFPEGYDAQAEFDTAARGYLSHVVVQLEDGSRYQLLFYDPVRLEQDLTADGRGYLAEPNMVILPEVTTENIRDAIRALWHERFFQHLKPL
jgi:hypothetical protein